MIVRGGSGPIPRLNGKLCSEEAGGSPGSWFPAEAGQGTLALQAQRQREGQLVPLNGQSHGLPGQRHCGLPPAVCPALLLCCASTPASNRASQEGSPGHARICSGVSSSPPSFWLSPPPPRLTLSSFQVRRKERRRGAKTVRDRDTRGCGKEMGPFMRRACGQSSP